MNRRARSLLGTLLLVGIVLSACMAGRPAYATSPLLNGGFEDGFRHWQQDGSGSVVQTNYSPYGGGAQVPPTEGLYEGEIVGGLGTRSWFAEDLGISASYLTPASTHGLTLASQGGMIWQTFNVGSEQTSFSLKASLFWDAKGSTGYYDYGGLIIKQNWTGGSIYTQEIGNSYDLGTVGRHYVDLAMFGTAGSYTVAFYAFTNDGLGAGDPEFAALVMDKISVTEAPEPSSATLLLGLGLSGLALLKRRARL